MPKLSNFRITKRFVDALVADRDALYFDADLRGFAVRTKRTGLKTYLVQYQSNGRTRRVSIGPHGVFTPAEARQKAAALLGRARAGEDPAEERAIARKAMTVRQLCDDYLAAADKGLVLGKDGSAKKASTLATDRGRIMRHIVPLLGSRKVSDLLTPDIVRFMRDVTSGKTAVDVRTRPRGRAIVEGGKGTVARTVGLLGGILSFAVSEGIIPFNPARGIRRPADGRRMVRLSDVQYAALGRALEIAESGPEPGHTVSAIRLLVHRFHETNHMGGFTFPSLVRSLAA
jgi:Arm DNA-binding domain